MDEMYTNYTSCNKDCVFGLFNGTEYTYRKLCIHLRSNYSCTAGVRRSSDTYVEQGLEAMDNYKSGALIRPG